MTRSARPGVRVPAPRQPVTRRRDRAAQLGRGAPLAGVYSPTPAVADPYSSQARSRGGFVRRFSLIAPQKQPSLTTPRCTLAGGTQSGRSLAW